ncbi:GNAT family N-acetyltransferase [Actinocorallia longicatena]|uniref:GNAT family N-acetyltransferase n=1 Tax=Actinocorallia longicatena TaxID=111803 RepID=A0ABP6QKT3_9ACTN
MPRAATGADEPRVREIVRAAYEPWIPVVGMRPVPMGADYTALIADGRVSVLGDPVSALIVLVPEPGVLLVENVAVDPAAQGRGLGRALLAFAEDEARRLGLPAVRLYTHRLMASNIALYERLGYVRSQETAPGLGHAVHLAKDLSSG